MGVTTDSCGLCRLHFYGGFRGTETSLDQRTDWTSNPSIIDAQGDRAVWFEDTIPCAGNVVFDGFIVTGAGRRKEAFRIVNTNAWISHVIIKDNKGIPFFLENVPFHGNHDAYSLTALVDAVVMDNQGQGWPASIAVSAKSQLKIFNSTITSNNCDSAWRNNQLSMFYFYSLKSECHIYNSIIWKNFSVKEIVDAALSGNSPEFYYKNSIIQNCSNPFGPWHIFGYHLGGCLDTNPMLTSDYHLQPSSPAIGLADINDYPFYQSMYLFTQHHPFDSWYKDVDAMPRFGQNAPGNLFLDAGAVQSEEFRLTEKEIWYYLLNKLPEGGNLPSQQQPQHAMEGNVDLATNSTPIIFPTLVFPTQNIQIRNIDGEYNISIHTIDGRLLSVYKCNGSSSIAAPKQKGVFLLVIAKEDSSYQETIYVK